MWFKFVSNNVCIDFRLPLSAFTIVAGKSFKGTFKPNWFSDRAFYVTIIDADIGRLLKSPHTLFDKYLDYMLVKFEQTRIVCKTKQNKTKQKTK